jgi:glutamine---fructose-6-phosphate transaminase (isomerizing)
MATHDSQQHQSGAPELRQKPPWVMHDMMDLQPRLAEDVLSREWPEVDALAGTLAQVVARAQPITVTGCGTSEHAAHAVAALIAASLEPTQRHLVAARPALTATLDPRPGLCIAISHDGETRATALALTAAAGRGASTAAISAARASSVAQAAECVLLTPLRDRSWCHTVAYTSAVLTGAALAVRLGAEALAPAAARDLLAAALDSSAGPLARRLADRRVILCAGIGLDLITARELALKIAEGARIPTVALELETVLHGQLAGHDRADGLVLLAVDEHGGGERVARRSEHVARAAAAIGMPVAAILSEPYHEALASELTSAGRLLVEATGASATSLRALLSGAGALQRVTLDLVHERGTNPDLIRREEPAYREAATAADSVARW